MIRSACQFFGVLRLFDSLAMPENPWMLQDLVEGKSPTGINNEQLLYEIPSLSTNKRGNMHIPPRNPPRRHHKRILKRRLAHEELIHQHTQGPEIHPLIIRPISPRPRPRPRRPRRSHHLRREVIKRTTIRRPPLTRRMHAPAKIRNLNLPMDTHQDILRLNIPMNNVLAVQIPQRPSHLRNIPRRPALSKPAAGRLTQVPTRTARPAPRTRG